MKKSYFLCLIGLFSLFACQDDFLKEMEETVTQQSTPGDRIWLHKPTLKSKATTIKEAQWTPGDVIKIKFLNGDTAIQNAVKRYASIWLKYAFITFEYVAPNEYADVKIGFDMDDSYISWSTIGVDCREIPQDQPSLNFTYLTGGTDEKTIKAEVLKGFGHVLGLLFEHQNPTSPVEIKPGADLVEEYNISQELADEIRNQYSSLECNYNEYDKYSIMVLGIPKKLLVNPRYYAPENYDLSPSDTALIAQQYPYPPACVTMETMKNTVSIVIDDMASLFHFWIDWGDGIKENTTHIRTNHTYKDGIAKHKITIGGGKNNRIVMRR